MRAELYEAIKAKIESTLPEIKHVDLWDYNVEFLEGETPIPRPAVFVEFGAISWQSLQGWCLRCRGEVSIHLVTDRAEGEDDTAFALSMKLLDALEGLSGEKYDVITLLRTETNRNHENILEIIDTYAVMYKIYPY